MAGEVWTGAVASVSATWHVPPILAGSPPGTAVTWVGAQSLLTHGTGPFIQLGTNVERLAGVSDHRDVYETFWSDVTHHFHPQPLFTVHPGDEVFAEMVHAGDRWQLTIVDRSTGRRRTFSTGQEGTGRFTLAQWLQEDPTYGVTHSAVAYPDLGPVRFAALRVDGTAPSTHRLAAQWLTSTPVDMGPSAVRGDAFSIVPVHPTAADAAYLKLQSHLTAASFRFAREIRGWTAQTPQRTVLAATDPLVHAVRASVRVLGRIRWPARSRRPVARLEGDLRRLSDALKPGDVAALGLPTLVDRLRAVLPTINPAALALRQALGVPAVD